MQVILVHITLIFWGFHSLIFLNLPLDMHKYLFFLAFALIFPDPVIDKAIYILLFLIQIAGNIFFSKWFFKFMSTMDDAIILAGSFYPIFESLKQ